MRVVPIDLPELGNRCHLVHDGSQALVIDPPRDLAVVERSAAEAEARASPPACSTRAGRAVVHVDDDWARVQGLAIPTTTGGLAA